MDMQEYIRSIHADYARKIEEFKQENSILYTALRDIRHQCNTFAEVQERAREADRQLEAICPFTQHLKELEAAEKAKEGQAA